MSKKGYFLVLLIGIISVINAKSQIIEHKDSSKVYFYKGRVINEEDKPLVFAHVINIHRGFATITDSTGYFRIPVVLTDTIRFSTIGYYTQLLSLANKNFRDTTFHIIRLQKREYDLPTVNIYELRWQVFKAEFMEEEVKEDKVAKNISNWMAHLVPAEELRMIDQSTRVPGFVINFRSKEEKARQKVAALEKKYQLIAPKFNDSMIRALTGLEGDAIYGFLKFCNFDEAFLIHASEYEIMERVLDYWKEYQRRGLDKKNKK